ncbi:hypothetical protein M422DRAFT_272498 [Sphaerobolus stellatus SS14]|uniref:Cytidyltransferase-like domain-containing protein n=1 Tax=Sphaerobolus stellatus (strain SS14) TaxID=990650 RepID=A0A0C9TXD3_SPHS4|nr:hypothetical protein M422DRAFT_272498 [Sphaerobolus stellatus SS14]
MNDVFSLDDTWDKVFYSGRSGLPTDVWRQIPAIELPDISDTPYLTTIPVTSSSSIFPVVALGGTFDHLHPGHKILLSMSAWITEKKIIVGVTDDALLTKKAYKEHLEPLPVRMDAVRDFLRLFKPGLIYDIVPISDVYGPTGWDPDIQGLVVSKETLPGAASIAAVRAEKSFPPLQTFVIDVISAVSADLGTDDPDILKHAKTSSTFIREWIHKRSQGPGSSTE